MDETFVIQQIKHIQQLLQHINSQDPHIQFTADESNQEGALPILDTLVSPGHNNTLVTTVYRQPTHTDQNLHLDSNHFIAAKKSVPNTLAFEGKGGLIQSTHTTTGNRSHQESPTCMHFSTMGSQQSMHQIQLQTQHPQYTNNHYRPT